jgi:hypothetical protein
MLFRFGFICMWPDQSLKVPEKIERAWRRMTFGELDIRVHPEAEVQTAAHGDRHLLLVGTLLGPPLSGRMAEALRSGGEDDLFEALDQMCGRFALISVFGRHVRILADAVGSRTIYYMRAPQPVVASHAALVAGAAGCAVCPKIADLTDAAEYKSLGIGYLPGDATFYSGVHALPPNHFLEFDTGKVRRFWPRKPVAKSSVESFVAHCTSYLRSFRDDLTTNTTALFGMTGGIDSRTLYAAFTESGLPFETVTWLARNFDAAERPITDALVQALRRPHAYLDYSSHPLGRVSKISRINAGEHRGHSRLTEAMYSGYGHRPDLFFVRGYGAAILRGFYNEPWRRNRPLSDLTPREMSRAYMAGLRGSPPGRRWQALVEDLFDRLAARTGMDAALRYGHDPSDIFFWEHRLGTMGAGMLNEMDAALPSLVGFNSRPLFDVAFGLPPQDRFSKKLLLNVVERFNAELSSIPVHKLKARRGASSLLRRLSVLRGAVGLGKR